MREHSQTAFASSWARAEGLQAIDEVLLIVLRMQPSEIDGLAMDDYWFWVGAAEREIKRRQRMNAG